MRKLIVIVILLALVVWPPLFRQDGKLVKSEAEAAVGTTALTVVTDGYDETDATSYTSAAVSPTDYTNHYLAVGTAQGGDNAAAPTVTGCNATWSLIDATNGSIPFNGNTGTNRRRVSVFHAYADFGTSCSLTIDYGATTQLRGQWTLFRVDGVDRENGNINRAIVQSATNNTSAGAATSLTVTLPSAFATTSNGTIGVFYQGTGGIATTEGSGFTELNENLASGFGTLQVIYRTTNDTTVDSSWTTNQRAGGIAWEARVSRADFVDVSEF